MSFLRSFWPHWLQSQSTSWQVQVSRDIIDVFVESDDEGRVARDEDEMSLFSGALRQVGQSRRMRFFRVVLFGGLAVQF